MAIKQDSFPQNRISACAMIHSSLSSFLSMDRTFAWSRRASGDVVITFDRKPVTTLRGKTAVRFLARIEGKGPEGSQQVMARFTGNFKRGNERR